MTTFDIIDKKTLFQFLEQKQTCLLEKCTISFKVDYKKYSLIKQILDRETNIELRISNDLAMIIYYNGVTFNFVI